MKLVRISTRTHKILKNRQINGHFNENRPAEDRQKSTKNGKIEKLTN